MSALENITQDERRAFAEKCNAAGFMLFNIAAAVRTGEMQTWRDRILCDLGEIEKITDALRSSIIGKDKLKVEELTMEENKILTPERLKEICDYLGEYVGDHEWKLIQEFRSSHNALAEALEKAKAVKFIEVMSEADKRYADCLAEIDRKNTAHAQEVRAENAAQMQRIISTIETAKSRHGDVMSSAMSLRKTREALDAIKSGSGIKDSDEPSARAKAIYETLYTQQCTKSAALQGIDIALACERNEALESACADVAEMCDHLSISPSDAACIRARIERSMERVPDEKLRVPSEPHLSAEKASERAHNLAKEVEDILDFSCHTQQDTDNSRKALAAIDRTLLRERNLQREADAKMLDDSVKFAYCSFDPRRVLVEEQAKIIRVSKESEA